MAAETEEEIVDSMNHDELLTLLGRLEDGSETEAWLGRLEKAYVHLRKDDPVEAVREARIAAETDPKKAALLFPQLYRRLGLFSKAAKAYQEVLTQDPDNSLALEGLVFSLLRDGETEEAVKVLEANPLLWESDPNLNTLAGISYLRLGRESEAREAFLKGKAPHLAPQVGEQAGLIGEVRPYAVDMLSYASQVAVPESPEGKIRLTAEGQLIVDLDGEGYSRMDGLRFVIGSGLRYDPAKRRMRGESREEIFGSPARPMFRLEGSGRLGFSLEEGVFLVLEAADRPIYLREDLVFAFDPEIYWENGRLPPAPGQPPLALLHLRGRGRVALHLHKVPSSLEITPARGALVPRSSIIGWSGRLIPREVVSSPFDAGVPALEFSGEGVILFSFR